MNSIIEMLPAQSHKTKRGEIFTLTLRKKKLSDQHNYWMYFVEAEHKLWRKTGFSVIVTKAAFPDEALADHLAQTLAMDEVKNRLEEATAEGRPLYLPVLHEGWVVH